MSMHRESRDEPYGEGLARAAEYAWTAGVVVLAFGVRCGLDPWLNGDAPYVMFYPAAALAAALWGGRAGVAALVLGGAEGWVIMMQHHASGPGNLAAQLFLLAVYVVVTGLIVGLAEWGQQQRDMYRVQSRRLTAALVRHRHVTAIVESTDDAVISMDLRGGGAGFRFWWRRR